MLSAMQRNVLILTHSADRFVVERVADALARRGARAFRFDTDLFPSETRLTWGMDGRDADRIRTKIDGIDVADVAAVWTRKVWTPRIDERVEPRMRAAAIRESTAALSGFLDALHGARWVDRPDVARAAENKLRQLRVARALGLSTPRTVMTNDPDAVRAFCAEHATIVAKLLRPLAIGMERQAFSVRTSVVRDSDLERLEGLRHAPMVFQELVPKAFELRVMCVGERTFAGAIDASRSERGATDWRAARPDEASWTRAEAPADVAAKLFALMRRLGLRQGAVDMIRTPGGDHVFLEINPSGEWGMLERDLGLPVSEAIADELLATDCEDACER